MIRKVRRLHLANFNIAGFTYWDGAEAWERLHIGTELRLVREADNAFDPYAVAIYLDNLKLGFIPKGQNSEISKYLDMGWKDIYEVRVQRLDPCAHTERQVEVIVSLKEATRRTKSLSA